MQTKNEAEKTKLQICKDVFNKWLEFDGDDEILDILFAVTIERKFKGIPLWFYFIVAPGALKSTIIQSIRFGVPQYVHGVDNLTSKSLVSGKPTIIVNDKEVKQSNNNTTNASFLQNLDGKVMLIKDLTTILSKDKYERNAIFGQLRSMWDGFYEPEFGSLVTKQFYKSSFGMIAGVTTIVDIYTRMNQVLGERMLKVRWNGNRKKIVIKASEHDGREDQMHRELQGAVQNLLTNRKFIDKGIKNEKYIKRLQYMALFLAEARTTVILQWSYRGEITDAKFEPQAEYGTRIVKQLQKLGKILTYLREKEEFTIEEYKTLWRIVKNSISPIRWKIINYLYHCQGQLKSGVEVNEGILQNYTSTKNRLKEMEYVKLVEHWADKGWCLTDKIKEYLDKIYGKKVE